MKEIKCIIKTACGECVCCYQCQERENCKKVCLNSPDKCRCTKTNEAMKKYNWGVGKR